MLVAVCHIQRTIDARAGKLCGLGVSAYLHESGIYPYCFLCSIVSTFTTSHPFFHSLRTLHSPLLASFFPTMASTPTTASVAAAHGKYVKLVDMARVAGTDGERDNALRLLAKLFPGGAPEAPYVEPTTLITIKELGSGIT
jgi:hypothetical protein